MTRWAAFGFALLLIGFAVFGNSEKSSGQANQGWTVLLDGAKPDLSKFNQVGNANWHNADGAVVADKGEGFLVTKDSYKDFQIRAEFWVNDDTNSGIFIRCTDPQKISGETSYEVNIWDKRPDPSYGTGAIVGLAKVPNPPPKAGGKWNTYEITAKGSSFTVVLNGQKTVDNAQGAKFPDGKIALQYGAVPAGYGPTVVKWRKVEIKPL